MRFGLVIGVIKLVTTSNYSILTNSHTLLLTIAHTMSSQFIFTGGCLVMDPNNIPFCSLCYWLATASHLSHGSSCWPLSHNWLAFPSGSNWHWLHRKHCFKQFSIVTCVSIVKETCLLVATKQWSSSSFVVASCVRCHGNVFISHSIPTAISSGSTIQVFQLPCQSVILKIVIMLSLVKELLFVL
jgi:hypothetical protein